ncbi:MAG: ArsR/SmtB family transcription factor, partial [Burkholderiales bacterium]
PHLASIGALIGVPTRAAMLLALADGQALPASELAYRAYLSPQTASTHLTKMVEGGLLSVERFGRHRYYKMANADVAQIVEHLMALAPPEKLRGRADRARVDPLRESRLCYGHLAGRLGVAMAEGLKGRRLVRLEGQDYRVTRNGESWFVEFGIDLARLRRQRQVFARRCIDWSERVPHIGGALGSALASRMFELKWIRRTKRPREVVLTDAGRRGLRGQLSLEW